MKRHVEGDRVRVLVPSLTGSIGVVEHVNVLKQSGRTFYRIRFPADHPDPLAAGQVLGYEHHEVEAA